MARILLVEDNEMNRDMLSRRLQRRGFEVCVAADGAESVEKARSAGPDLILMDMGLPVLDGYQATRLIKSSDRTRFIPILGLSAHAMSGDAERALEAGCDDYDTKPVEWRRLMAKIDGLLVRAQDTSDEPDSPLALAGMDKPAAGHILVADDDSVNREILCRRLRGLGYSFDLAKDGLDVLHSLECRHYDAMLLDLTLPSIDGFQVLERVRSDAALKALPCIVIVPADAIDSAVRAIEAGAEDFVPKPFNREVLGLRLRSALDKRRLLELLEKGAEKTPPPDQNHLGGNVLNGLMPELFAEELKVTSRVPARRHDGVTLLCLGLAHFQELYATTPEWLVQNLRKINETLDEVTARHQLAKIHGFGDTYLAAGGLFPHELNPVSAAVRAAFEGIEAVRSLDLELDLSVGLHRGSAVGGVADPKRFRFDLWGENVGLAGRIQELSPAGGVLVSARAWKQAADICHGTLCHRLELPGDDDGLSLYRIEGLLG